MSFGYNANLFKDCASGRIDDFANNLIAMLSAERQEQNVRVTMYNIGLIRHHY